MAYADRSTGGSRIVAIVVVSVVVALLFYGFVNGLTFSYVKKMTEKLNTFDVQEPPPPPPDKPPPPPPEQPQLQTPPVVSPPPIVRVQSPPPMIVNVPTPPPAAPIVVRAASPAPVPPPPAVSKAAAKKGDPSGWVTTDDYPSDALNAGAQGTTKVRWEVNTAGRVENCTVVASSGNAALDRAACSNITRRGRYSPALDQAGNPIRSSDGRNVVWRVPE